MKEHDYIRIVLEDYHQPEKLFIRRDFVNDPQVIAFLGELHQQALEAEPVEDWSFRDVDYKLFKKNRRGQIVFFLNHSGEIVFS